MFLTEKSKRESMFDSAVASHLVKWCGGKSQLFKLGNTLFLLGVLSMIFPPGLRRFLTFSIKPTGSAKCSITSKKVIISNLGKSDFWQNSSNDKANTFSRPKVSFAI